MYSGVHSVGSPEVIFVWYHELPIVPLYIVSRFKKSLDTCLFIIRTNIFQISSTRYHFSATIVYI